MNLNWGLLSGDVFPVTGGEWKVAHGRPTGSNCSPTTSLATWPTVFAAVDLGRPQDETAWFSVHRGRDVFQSRGGENVNMPDLKFTITSAPSYVAEGDKLRFTAEVAEYNPNSCLFFLTPVSTTVRKRHGPR
ncbi:DUF4839 domain-containing protein [Arthrobacter globiformis]|uniref:DUF4839 domain-containing protein n=1 Tax=Arthrobacter globiformis TaxID=1665 RepID=UPI0027884792|nr:DUF4839 domain-containing protein [Arthrobacter globiformis]MDQ0864726.1 hypothetical protein [Arthrobacter globiformis]